MVVVTLHVSDGDQELTRQALSGDPNARRKLAAKLLEGIRREVTQCLIRAARAARRDARQEVRDLVQDVLVCLFENDCRELRRWDPQRGRALDSFVRLVTRRRVARTLGQLRGNPWADTPTEHDDLERTDDATLVQRLEDRAQLDQVLAALHERMSARDHELFELLFVEERDPDEVAKLMEMSRGAVNAWSYRMRKHARAVVAELEQTSSLAAETAAKGKVNHGR